MSVSTPKSHWLAWGALGATLAAITVAYLLSALGGTGKPLPVQNKVDPFTLTNHLGAQISLPDLEGEVWVADIIFTRCASSCARMSQRLSTLQEKLPARSGVRLVSLTADPEFDTPKVLEAYARRYNAGPRWQFLTGSKKDIYRMTVDSLKLVVRDRSKEERAPDEELFLHSTYFVLVDRAGRVRGHFESEDPGSLRQLLRAIRQLERER